MLNINVKSEGYKTMKEYVKSFDVSIFGGVECYCVLLHNLT